MRVFWAGQAQVREIEGRVSEGVPWSSDQTDVSAGSPPPAVCPAPSVSAPPSSAAAPASSAAPVSAAGTDSLPAGSSAGPEEKGKRRGKGKYRVGGEVGEEVWEGRHGWRSDDRMKECFSSP